MKIAIMAGGVGTRFWPLSRQAAPKQYLAILSASSMILETYERIRPLAGDTDVFLVINKMHKELTDGIFAGKPVRILAEPVGRNTAACIALACLHAEQSRSDEPVAFLPADHYIKDAQAFRDLLVKAGEIATSGAIVTLGVVPDRAETGYGYIKRGEKMQEAGGVEAYEVAAFVEKPDLQQAVSYVDSGEYYWNAGMFIARADVLLDEIEKLLPDLHRGLTSLKGHLDGADYDRFLAEAYGRIPSISIDYGIMERTDRPRVVLPASFGWTDVGSWEALYEHRKGSRDEAGNVVEGDAVAMDTRSSLVISRGNRMVACLGLNDCLVVDTKDAVLVANLKSSQSVRDLLARLEEMGKEGLV